MILPTNLAAVKSRAESMCDPRLRSTWNCREESLVRFVIPHIKRGPDVTLDVRLHRNLMRSMELRTQTSPLRILRPEDLTRELEIC